MYLKHLRPFYNSRYFFLYLVCLYIVALFSCQLFHSVKSKKKLSPMAYQWPEGMSRIKLSYRSLIVLNDISSWAIVMNFGF